MARAEDFASGVGLRGRPFVLACMNEFRPGEGEIDRVRAPLRAFGGSALVVVTLAAVARYDADADVRPHMREARSQELVKLTSHLGLVWDEQGASSALFVLDSEATLCFAHVSSASSLEAVFEDALARAARTHHVLGIG